MKRSGEIVEKGIRAMSVIVTVITLIWLTDFFVDSLISCLLLIWKHTAGHIDTPVLGQTGDMEIELIGWFGFAIAVIAVCGMRKRIVDVFRGKPGKWCAVLSFPLFVVTLVTYTANWGASYGILLRSGGNMGLYYDQVFSYVGWGVLSGLSLFAVGAYVLGMDRVYVEQKKAEQYRAQVTLYQTLEEQYSQAERLRHDLKNHVLALRGLWEEQAWEKLGDYLERMEGSAQLGSGEEATGNRAVDALLCQKRKTAEEKGIDWECDVQIPMPCPVNEFDLCVLFGNLLDNALQACERLKRKAEGQKTTPFIRLRAGAVKRCFLLEIKNSVDASEEPKTGALPKELKKGKSTAQEIPHGHGIGLLNVGDVVQKYSGAMNAEMHDGMFAISVLLPFGDRI